MQMLRNASDSQLLQTVVLVASIETLAASQQPVFCNIIRLSPNTQPNNQVLL